MKHTRRWLGAAMAPVVLAAGTAVWSQETAVVSTEEERSDAVATPNAPPDDGVGPVKPVIVVNPSNRPVPVTGSVDVTGEVTVGNVLRVVEAPRQPYNASEEIHIEDGEALGSRTYLTVPKGKQLVMTHASCRMPDGYPMSFIVQGVSNGTLRAAHALVPMPAGPIAIGGRNTIVASQPLEMILQAGIELHVSVVRDGTAGSAVGRCGISGYFVDVPEETLSVQE